MRPPAVPAASAMPDGTVPRWPRSEPRFFAARSEPDRPDIKWSDVEALMEALGATVKEGRGSRVRFLLNDVRAVFHRPHPAPETGKATVKDLRKFLINAGIES